MPAPEPVSAMSKPSCERCGAEGPLVKLTQVVNDETTRHVLCEECAATKGMQIPSSAGDAALAGLLDQLVKVEDQGSGEASDDAACPYCGLSFEGFRSSGLLGCPQCYAAFADRISEIVRRVHRGERHVGKVYLPPDPSVTRYGRAVAALKRTLERAVLEEDFERAAEIRDRLHEMEPVR